MMGRDSEVGVRKKRELALLTRFMVKWFAESVLSERYAGVVSGVDQPSMTVQGLAAFTEMLMRRVGATRLQFKKMCCLVTKFLERCRLGPNFMQFINHSIKKLITVALILSVPNVTGDYAAQILHREALFERYAKATGLEVEQINNCYPIVRLVVIHQTKLQLRDQRRRHDDSGEEAYMEVQISKLLNNTTSEYIIAAELEEFEEAGRKAVLEHFEMV